VHGGRQGADSPDRSDVEDAAGALPDHLLVKRFGDGKQTAHVGVDDFIPGLIGGGGKVIPAIDGGVVHQNVHPAPFLHQLAGQMLQAIAVDNRHLERAHAASKCLYFFLHFFSQVVA
jgi:hypothetical protein